MLHVTIATDGSVKDAVVVSGDPRLTDAAIDAVRQWEFQPFIANGMPVEGHRDVAVNFSLDHPSLQAAPIFKATDPGVTAPMLAYSRDPEYSEAARQAHLTGQVMLALVVGSDGTPQDIMVTSHLGSGLDENAIEAVKTWRFRPGTKDGKPVAVAMNVTVTFQRY
jgi:TonB family protein